MVEGQDGLTDERFDATDWGRVFAFGYYVGKRGKASVFLDVTPEEIRVRDWLYASKFGLRARIALDVGWVFDPWGCGGVEGWTSYGPAGQSGSHDHPSLTDAMDEAGVPDYPNDPTAFPSIERSLWCLGLWDAYKARLEDLGTTLTDKLEAADWAIRSFRVSFAGEVWPLSMGTAPAPKLSDYTGMEPVL
jgi:hypothetical protein